MRDLTRLSVGCMSGGSADLKPPAGTLFAAPLHFLRTGSPLKKHRANPSVRLAAIVSSFPFLQAAFADHRREDEALRLLKAVHWQRSVCGGKFVFFEYVA